MFQITIHGETLDVLKAKTAEFLASVSGAAVAAVEKTEQVLTGAEQSKLRGDATIVPPKSPTAAEKKAAEKAAKEAAEKAAKEAAAKAEAEAAAKAEAEALGEGGEEETEATGDAEETFTHDDAKALLLEVKAAYPKDATIISKIVQEAGKAKKISDVAEESLAAVVAKCRELLKKAGK